MSTNTTHHIERKSWRWHLWRQIKSPLTIWFWVPQSIKHAHYVLFTLKIFSSIRTPGAGEPMGVTREDLQHSMEFVDVHGALEFLIHKGYAQATGSGFDTRYTITPAGTAAELEQNILTSAFKN